MQTIKKKVLDRYYLEVDLLEVNQGGSSFFVGKIPAQDLIDCFTVEPAEYESQEYRSIASTFEKDEDYYNFLQSDLQSRIDTKAFQRKEDKIRIGKIKKFLEGNETPFFPNAVIATCELINDKLGIAEDTSFTEELVNELEKGSNLSFYQKQGNSQKLYVPVTSKSLLIIDGQHRIKGLEASDLDKIGSYEVLMVFVIGFDKSVVAYLFYTVNYHQKAVNKSLLYHLMGEFSRDLDEVTFLHQVVRLLNELEKSPLCSRIKMLGVSPKDLPPDERKLATISQAFLVDELLTSISSTSSSSIYQPVFCYFYKNKDYQIQIAKMLVYYFQAIEDLFGNMWKDVDNFVISKSISIGAFLKVFRLIFVKILVNDYNLNINDLIVNVTDTTFREKLEGVQSLDFSKEGEFGGVGSGGSLGKIKKKIIESANIFERKSYDDSIESFKQNELVKYKSWFEKNS